MFQEIVTGLNVKRMVTAYRMSLNVIPYPIVGMETRPMKNVRFAACQSSLYLL